MTTTNYGPLVDDYGKVQAELADKLVKEAGLRAQLIKLGEGSFEGKVFRVTISQSESKSKDAKLKSKINALIKKYITPQFVAAHTTKKPKWSILALARNNENVKTGA